MKYSELLVKTRKDKSKDTDSVNADLLIRASYIDQLSAGVYSFLPLGYKVLTKINDIIREEMNDIGSQELIMPALQSAEIWKKTGRYDVDVSFKTKSVTGQEYVLGWTHEEIITPIIKKYISSYRDLPLSVYQIQTKFRDEKRSKSGILRGREFLMKDMYSFHTTQKDLDRYYKLSEVAYKNVFDRCGVGKMTVKTYSSGGDFSKFSHEFQTINEVGEDTIYFCKKCNIAVNKEIIETVKTCPECSGNVLDEVRAIEVGNIFKLGTRFSEAFDMNFTDEDGKQKPVIMASYGIGPSRLMGAIVEVSHDERGIVWPKSVAPYHVVLVSLGDDDVQKVAEKLYKDMQKRGVEVLWDDRDESAGTKLADADLLGIPLRVLLSRKTLDNDSAELKLRDNEQTNNVRLDKLNAHIAESLASVK